MHTFRKYTITNTRYFLYKSVCYNKFSRSCYSAGMPSYAYESGRSMIEMLGVLAIIGVLSVGGVAGYTSTMNKHKANELLNEASKRAVVCMAQIEAGNSPSVSDFGPFDGYSFTVAPNPANANQFQLTLSGKTIPEAVCNNMENTVGNSTPVRDIVADCNNASNMVLTYNNDMSATTNYDESQSVCESAGGNWVCPRIISEILKAKDEGMDDDEIDALLSSRFDLTLADLKCACELGTIEQYVECPDVGSCIHYGPNENASCAGGFRSTYCITCPKEYELVTYPKGEFGTSVMCLDSPQKACAKNPYLDGYDGCVECPEGQSPYCYVHEDVYAVGQCICVENT